MIAASMPVQRPKDAKLLAVDILGSITQHSRSEFPTLLRDGDTLVANDAATLPASLFGTHIRTGRPIEVRLAGLSSLPPEPISHFSAVIFGAGDYRTPTEHRPSPPELIPGDRLQLGSLSASVLHLLNHPRFILLRLDGSVSEVWRNLARNGHPIQYAYVPTPLAMWDTWTPVAAVPAAFEAPSASFILDWRTLQLLNDRGIRIATLTHAAGISSTGDLKLDAQLPFPEPYSISEAAAALIEESRVRAGRLIAVGTSVVRALEHVFSRYGYVRAGTGLATQRMDRNTSVALVDAIVSGAHEPETSHHEMLRSFVDDQLLLKIDNELEVHGYRTHEFGDSVFIEKSKDQLVRSDCESRDLATGANGPVRSVFIQQ